MFNKLCKLLFIYVVLTFLFSDLSAIKDPGKDFFAQQYEDVSRVAKKIVNYVDGTVIPYVDSKFDEADLEKSLAGNLIDKFNEESTDEIQLIKSSHTVLFGQGSKLDSMGLINLIVAVEQSVEDEFDITITLADERAMSQENSPFRTVGSLADYIELLLEEKLND